MFALHETTQRRTCRVIFLVAGVLPTLLTLAWIAYWHRPWRQEDWQRSLAQRLHVRATLDEITSPRPGVTVLNNLRLADLRTDQRLGSMAKLSFRRQNSRLTLQADQLEIQAEQLPALATAITTWLAISESVPLDFHADQLTITSQSLQVVELNNLSIRSDASDPRGQRFLLKALDSAGETLRLALENNQESLRSKLDTQQAPLPAWLLGKLVPGVSGCGEAKFLGVMTTDSANQHLRGQLQGQFEQVDLQTWIGAASPHRLQGTAQVQLEQLTWRDERIETAQGRIEAGSGAGSFSILLSARDLCKCGTGPAWGTLRPATREELVRFDRLALSFQMSSAGIAVVGQCEAGALMVAGSTPLLFGPPKETKLSVGQFVQLLDYRHLPWWLPATLRSHEMAEKLPLPTAADHQAEPIRQ